MPFHFVNERNSATKRFLKYERLPTVSLPVRGRTAESKPQTCQPRHARATFRVSETVKCKVPRAAALGSWAKLGLAGSMAWNADTPGSRAALTGGVKVLWEPVPPGPPYGHRSVTTVGKTDLVLSAALQDPPHAPFLLLLPQAREPALAHTVLPSLPDP